MKKRRKKRIRLAFEPNRFATEQLIKIYEELKPFKVRSAVAPSSSNPARGRRSAKKGGEQ
jgi:hypothetical protein